jgi:N-acetylglucosamine kinase-like BadF-type ATPase
MLGHRDGCSMICGTGSALYMRKGDDYSHIGGGGCLIDSAGSGFALGRLAIQASLRAVNGGGPPTILTELLNEQGGCEMWDNMVGIYAKGRAYVASFARTVFEARRRGDVVARGIFNTCATDMANVIWGAYSRMGGGFDLVLNGGIVTNFPEYAAAIRALAPPDINVIFSNVPPVYGCAVEAMYDVGNDCSTAFRERFLEGYGAMKP